MRNTDYILEKLREVARRTVRRGYQSIARSFDTRGLLAEERETFTSFSGVVLNRTTDYSYDAAGRTLGTYTDHLYYAEGSAEPRYTGCPTARETTIGGRYDYRYDAHDRLTAADYTPGTDAAADEDFSTVYTYDDAANPLSVRRYGVIGTEADGTEEFGIVDDLTFAYEGNQVQSIANAPEGEDFYGRTGYGAVEGESAYAWNDQGYMTADASRGITNIKYNHQGLPVQMRFSNGDMTVCSYDASGLLTKSMTIGRRSALRDYVADRVFSTGALLYSYFPGGYFDADGAPHYLHTDYQGSVVMVTDSAGTIEQHTSYYPYGEPHRSPAGQPILYGGKERLATTDDYNYGARRHHAPAINWPTPDNKASSFYNISPYVFCKSNPILNVDHDGNFSHKYVADYSHTLYNWHHKIQAGPVRQNRDATEERFRWAYNTVGRDPNPDPEFGQGVEVTMHYKLDKTLAQDMQTIGTAAEVVGYGVTVLGAEPLGGAIFKVGNYVSSTGSLIEAAVDAINQEPNDDNSIQNSLFVLLNAYIDHTLKNNIPGVGAFKSILRQGTALKLSLGEWITNKFLNRKQVTFPEEDAAIETIIEEETNDKNK